ncbi:MAG: DedA family protein [Methylobacteriaceae bacterium]|nr:DedA family protein [Methylobacteriaceae bacterium]
MLHVWIQPIVAQFGLYAVFLIVMLESAGVPLPGETALVLAAIFAGITGQLDIVHVIVVAAAGAIIGDNIGFMVGRRYGLPLVKRYGALVGLDDRRLAFGQHMFARHGAKIVFFGRFVAILRIFAALLAGVNHSSWRSFLFYNAAGGIVWASVFGIGGYVFGDAMHRVAGPVGMIGLAFAVIGLVAGWWVMRRQEERYEREFLEQSEQEAARLPDDDERRRAARD